MNVTVKICGINAADAADAAARAGADFGGLMFHRASPRYVEPERARALAERLRGRLRLVALLSDPSDEAVAEAVRAVRPDFLQLHGRESPERVADVRQRFGIGVIKALPVAVESDLASVATFEQVAEMLLFDAKAPDGSAQQGGRGVAFDWKILKGRSFKRPWLLAGGLTPENVARAIAISAAPGVDVSSGVETAPGRKSPELIGTFVANARAPQLSEQETP